MADFNNLFGKDRDIVQETGASVGQKLRVASNGVELEGFNLSAESTAATPPSPVLFNLYQHPFTFRGITTITQSDDFSEPILAFTGDQTTSIARGTVWRLNGNFIHVPFDTSAQFRFNGTMTGNHWGLGPNNVNDSGTFGGTPVALQGDDEGITVLDRYTPPLPAMTDITGIGVETATSVTYDAVSPAVTYTLTEFIDSDLFTGDITASQAATTAFLNDTAVGNYYRITGNTDANFNSYTGATFIISEIDGNQITIDFINGGTINTSNPNETLTGNITFEQVNINFVGAMNPGVAGVTTVTGGLTVTGATTLETSLTGLLRADAGVVSVGSAGVSYTGADNFVPLANGANAASGLDQSPISVTDASTGTTHTGFGLQLTLDTGTVYLEIRDITGNPTIVEGTRIVLPALLTGTFAQYSEMEFNVLSVSNDNYRLLATTEAPEGTVFFGTLTVTVGGGAPATVTVDGNLTVTEGITRTGTGTTTTDGISFWSGTNAQYTALGTSRDQNTIYYVTDA